MNGRHFIPKLTVVASEQHFVDHVAPIYKAFPEKLRGRFYCGVGERRHVLALQRAREHHGIDAKGGWLPVGARGLCVVASVGDLAQIRRPAPRMDIAFMEHGCGITYKGGGASYIGSSKRHGVKVILTPSERTKALQLKATPKIRVVSLGSSPRLDEWAPGQPRREAYEPSTPPVVALSWHWDCKVNPETRTALPWYRRELGLVTAGPWDVIGHSHPRIWPTLKVVYDHWGIEKVRQFDDVMDRASVYSMDNSSTLYEFAATGRPVVVVNCPRYRRHMDHGLRFWEAIPGIQCDEAAALPKAIELALEDGPELREMREEAVSIVYPQHDGKATERAVDVLRETLTELNVTAYKKASAWVEWQVFDADGQKIADPYLVEYEARTHAAKIGGYFERVNHEEVLV